MKDIKFRTLRADEIEVRPQSIKDGKAIMLLYIDSRAVVSLLNETVGNMNWQSEFYDAGDQIIGRIGIYDDDRGIWVWKSDIGTESNVDAEKGKISDTYKRVLSRWGVQELYTAPRITCEDDRYGNNGYKVSHIEYDENRTIIALKIVNRFGKEVFSWMKDNQTTKETPVKDNKTVLTEFCTERKTQGDDILALKKFYEYYSGKVPEWKGQFNPEKLYSKWSKAA